MICIFCGEHAGTSIVAPYTYLSGVPENEANEEIRVHLPVCTECAAELENIHYASLEGASRYLASVYREVYAHLLSDFLWSPEELADLGYGLRASIEQAHKAHLETVARVRCCEKVGLLGPKIPEDIFDDIVYEAENQKKQ